MSSYPSLCQALNFLVGRSVSEVIFLEGYFQINFDNSKLTFLSSVVASDIAGSVSSGSDLFRNWIVDLKGSFVDRVEEIGDILTLAFSGNRTLTIDFSEPSSLPERVIFQDDVGSFWVA